MPARMRGGPSEVAGVQLMQNEAVLRDVTPAWSIYARSLLFGALLLLAGLAEAAVSDGQNEASGAAIMGIVVFAVIFGYAFYRRSRTHYIVTDSRVVKRTGLFLSTNIEEAGYEMITGVGTEQSRFQSLFGNGTVKVATSGGIGTIELVGAPNAKDLANLIRDRHPTLGARGRGAPASGTGPGGRPAGNRGAPNGAANGRSGGRGPQGGQTRNGPARGKGTGNGRGGRGPEARGGRQQPGGPQGGRGRNDHPPNGQPPTGQPSNGHPREQPPNGGRGRQPPEDRGGHQPRDGRSRPGGDAGSPGEPARAPNEKQPPREGPREEEEDYQPVGADGPDSDGEDEASEWNPDDRR